MNNKEDSLFDDPVLMEAFKRHEELVNERMKTVKKGPKVIHLEYYSGDYSRNLITDFEEKLKEIDLEFSSFDKSGIPFNSLDDFTLTTFLVIAQPILGELINSFGTSIIWDVIKYIAKKYWKALKSASLSRVSGEKVVESKISFGLRCKLDPNTSFDFELSGDVSEETVEVMLDKTLTFLKDVKLNEEYQNTAYANFDTTNERWISVNVAEELRKRVEKNKAQ